MRGTDTVARLGGDEFAIVQIGAPADRRQRARRRASSRRLSEPFDVHGHQVDHRHQHRHRPRADRRQRARPAAAQRRHGALSRQGRRPRHLSLLRAGDGRADAGAPPARARSAQGARSPSEFELYYQPLVDLDERRGLRLRGAAALEPSRARPGPARRVHSGRRGDRPDRAARRLGAAAGLHATPPPGRASSRSRSICRRCSSAIRRWRCRWCRRSAQSGLPASRLELEITETVLLQDDRAVLDALHQLRELGVRISHGRFRHRLFLAELSAQLPVRQDQDRPLLRPRARQGERLRRHHPRGHAARLAASA